MQKAVELRQQKAAAIAAAKAIQKQARDAGRDLSDTEAGQVRSLLDEADDYERAAVRYEEGELGTSYAVAERLDKAAGDLTKPSGSKVRGCNRAIGKAGEDSLGGGYHPAAESPDGEIIEWTNVRSGKSVVALRGGAKLTALPFVQEACRGIDPDELSLGRFICGHVTGDFRNAPIEASLGTNIDSAGGVLVPSPLAARVIDLARAKTVVFQAGAQTVPMTSTTLDIARVATDPTFQVKADNQAFSSTDIVFDAVSLTAYKIGCVVHASRELIDDATNAEAVIEATIVRALAAEIDRLALLGSGSQEPVGLLNFDGINTTSVGGSVDYDNILDAVATIEAANGQANAYILSAANKKVLAELKSTTGEYLQPPRDVLALVQLQTESVGDSRMFVGDFRQFIVGLRQEARVEVSPVEGDTMKKHQLAIKVTWRGDFAAEHFDHFVALTDIS